MFNHVKFFNGQKMPILGLGTGQMTDPQELTTAMNDALAAGYRHFDTAYIYRNERIIGNIIQEWLNSRKVTREELFIVTKLPPIGMDETRVEYFLKLSLAALQLDYVDLYLIHQPIGLKYLDDETHFPKVGNELDLDMTTDHLKIWKAMEAQVAAKRVKAIGLSNFNASQIERIINSAHVMPANIQVETHAYLQQKDLLEFCRKHGITFTAYAPFGSPGRAALYQKMGIKNFKAPALLSDPLVGAIAEAHCKTPAQILLIFLTQQEIVVIPKSRNPQRIVENTDIFNWSLSPTEMEQLQQLDQGESGRTFNLITTFPEAAKHPEVPYA